MTVEIEPDSGSFNVEVRARGPASAGRTDLRARAWVLLALDASARNGITPMSKLRFHRFIYLTNALSPVYDVQAADERIVKYQRGQFYPDLQWHLDRLMAAGLVRIANIRHFEDEDGPWMEADYRLGRPAIHAIERLVALDDMRALSTFLQEVAKAFANHQEDVLDDLILADLTYADARRARGSVINFSQPRDNLSVQAANSFMTITRDPRMISASDRLYLYVDYMDRLHHRPLRRA
jgi:hypothetical protein